MADRTRLPSSRPIQAACLLCGKPGALWLVSQAPRVRECGLCAACREVATIGQVDAKLTAASRRRRPVVTMDEVEAARAAYKARTERVASLRSPRRR